MNEINSKKGKKIIASSEKDLEQKIALGLEKAGRAVAKGASSFLKKARFWIGNFSKKASSGFTEFEHKAEEKISRTAKNVKDWEHRAADNVRGFEHKAEEKVKKAVEGVKDWEHKAENKVKNLGQKAEEKLSKAAVDVKNWERAAEDNVREFEHKAALNVKKFAESVKHIRPQKKIKIAPEPIPEKIAAEEPVGSAKRTGFKNLFKKIELANPVKILIIEDEAVLAEVLKEKLKKANLEVKIARDGEEAISIIKSFEPDVIVLDLILPKVSGFEVLKQVKADEKLSRIPVVVLSNLSDDENIKKAMNMGAMDYFVKANHPINEIVEKIKGTLLKAK